MSVPMLPREIIEFLRDAGLTVGTIECDDGLVVADTEVQSVVRLTAGVYTVESISRGVSNGLDLITEEIAAVERFLAVLYGHVWRDLHHVERLNATSGSPTFPAGYEIVDEGGWKFTVRWSQDGRDCRASGLNRAKIVEVARALPFSLDEVITSFKDLEGRPVYPQAKKAPPRTWRR